MRHFMQGALAIVASVVIATFVFHVGALIRQHIPTPSPIVHCWPISPSLSTGTVRCWSGGKLVYNRAIYHNGGVLCSVDGQQITLNKADLCVVESSQSNVWSPPPPVDR